MSERPDWMDDETKLPPSPLLRCPRCKTIFSDHAIHICRDLNEAPAHGQSVNEGGKNG